MDFTAMYCPVRRDLEEKGWFLTSRLAALTDHLIRLSRCDHGAFLAAKGECQQARRDISSAHVELKEHRRMHGC